MPVGGRVAGKVGIYSSHYNGNVNKDIVILTLRERRDERTVVCSFAQYAKCHQQGGFR